MWCQICGVETPRHDNYCQECTDILDSYREESDTDER